jgi:hypothetical protein
VYSCKDKECVICGKFYLPTGRNQKTCSDECCKELVATQKAKRYQENKEKFCEYSKQRYQENKEQILERNKQHYQENREQILERQKQYQQENIEEKKEYDKQRHQTKMNKGVAGLYSILNKITDQYYIGESLCYDARENEHKRRLKGGRHENSLLQKDYDKYGADAFEFAMVKEINKEDFQSEKELKGYLRVEEAKLISEEARAGKKLYNMRLLGKD